MRTITLPNTDLQVSVIAMGCWALAGDNVWGEQPQDLTDSAVAAALDLGINFFDTAEMYGYGAADAALGHALRGRRDRAVIASKIRPQDMARQSVIEACERTLQRLQTDHLDLYQIHWPSREVRLEETWDAMQSLKQQGKVRALGVCNFGPADLAALDAVAAPGEVATDQVAYSLLSRMIEHEILPAAQQRGLGVLAYSPIMQGLLADKYMDADEVPAPRARTRHFSTDRPLARHGEGGCEAETFAAISAIRDIARKLDRPMSDLALAWLLHQPAVTSVLVGIRTPEQARRNAAPLDLALDADTLARLDEATRPVKDALGPNADMWQPADQSRIR